MILGEVEIWRQKTSGRKVNECYDWERVKRTLNFYLSMDVDTNTILLPVEQPNSATGVIKNNDPDQCNEKERR